MDAAAQPIALAPLRASLDDDDRDEEARLLESSYEDSPNETLESLESPESPESPEPPPSSPPTSPTPPSLPRYLYLSHLLSTFNARLFEFAAVLFLAAAFPASLLPVSLYAALRALAALLGADALGACIDRGHRLRVVRVSIVGQRAAVAVSCAVFFAMGVGRPGGGGPPSARPAAWLRAVSPGVVPWLRAPAAAPATPATPATPMSAPDVALLAAATAAACIEKLCAVLNLVAVERDWVVVMTEGDEAGRRSKSARATAALRCVTLSLTSVLPRSPQRPHAPHRPRLQAHGPAGHRARGRGVDARRAVGHARPELRLRAGRVLVHCAGGSGPSACLFVPCGSANARNQVYDRVPALHRRPAPAPPQPSTPAPSPAASAAPPSLLSAVLAAARRLLPLASLPDYFRHPVALPSFALAVLYLNVLTFSGQMVTFLLAVGYSPLAVGLVRTASSVCELSATWLAPRLMRRVGVVRAGIWSLSWQALWLTAAAFWFYGLAAAAAPTPNPASALLAASGLVAGVALSRVGLWSYDLCAQSIVQDEVAGARRGAFSTAEAAFQNLFEVLAYATTIACPRPAQFGYPALVSIAAVYVASALYAAFVRQRRCHLFHSPLPWLDKAFRRGSGRF